LVGKVRFQQSDRTGAVRNLLPSRSQKNERVVIKSVRGHSRVKNERDTLRRFEGRTPYLRPLLDEIEVPSEPITIVLKYLDDNLQNASNKTTLSRKELKYVSKRILEALSTLHEDGFVHTGKLSSFTGMLSSNHSARCEARQCPSQLRSRWCKIYRCTAERLW
jgi:serine/threonine protein kinase